jgi:hypothetical protein
MTALQLLEKGQDLFIKGEHLEALKMLMLAEVVFEKHGAQQGEGSDDPDSFWEGAIWASKMLTGRMLSGDKRPAADLSVSLDLLDLFDPGDGPSLN